MRIFSQKSDDWTFLISLNNELRGSRICGELLTPGLCPVDKDWVDLARIMAVNFASLGDNDDGKSLLVNGFEF